MSEDTKKRIKIGQHTLNSRNKNAPDPQKIVDTDRRIQEKYCEMDMENVVKGLNDIGGFIAGRIGIEQARNFLRTLDKTIAMLKEQKAVEPEIVMLNKISRLYSCPKCHKCFFYEKQKYCDQCGQAVKWE